MTHQEQYQKIINKLNQLQEELSIAKKEYEEKESILEDTINQETILEDCLYGLKDDKYNMINLKKEKISNIFGYISTSFLALISIAGCAIGLYYINNNLSLLKPIIIACSIMSAELIISTIAERIIKNKIVAKIENSEEYNKLLKEINSKEEELIRLRQMLQNLKIEYKDLQSKVYTLTNQVEEQNDNLNALKDKVFIATIGLQSDIEVKNKLLIKKKYNKQGE